MSAIYRRHGGGGGGGGGYEDGTTSRVRWGSPLQGGAMGGGELGVGGGSGLFPAWPKNMRRSRDISSTAGNWRKAADHSFSSSGYQ